VLNRTFGISWILFLAGALLTCIGFFANAMWQKIPWGPDWLLVALGAGSIILGYVFGRLFHCQPATSAAAVWVAALIYFAGLSPAGSVLLIAVAALAIGSVLVHQKGSGQGALSVLGGLAMLCGIDGWLLPFPLHWHAGYLLVLLAIITLRRRAVVRFVQPLSESWSAAVMSAPYAALLTVVGVGMVSTCAWMPTIRYDDLSYHLGLPYQLQTFGYYSMNAGSQVWAAAAWAADVLQGIAQVVAGSESQRAVNALWFGLALSLMWSLCKELGLSPAMRWLAVVLFASVPLTGAAIAGMQTEAATAAVVAGLGLLIQRTQNPDWRLVLLAGLLFGLLLGLKVSNLMFAGPLGLWMLWRWRQAMPWRVAAIAIGMMLLVAGSSYVYSYLLTGNPVLPLFNGLFESPFIKLTQNHGPHRLVGGYSRLLWDLTFHSSRYGQSADGTGGFALLALSGSLLAAIFHRRARPVALVAFVAFLLPLTQVQYLRYPHPALILVIPAMLCGIRVDLWAKHRARTAGIFLTLLVVGDLAFVPNADWQLRQGGLRSLLSQGDVATMDLYAPMRNVARLIRNRYGSDARTLIVDRSSPFTAEFAGSAFAISWYDQELAALAPKAGKFLDSEGWMAFFDHTGVDLVVVNKDELTPALNAALSQDQGRKAYEFSDLELWELHPGRSAVAVPSPPHSVIVKFDTSASPPAETIVQAHVTLHCRPIAIPIVISWDIAFESGQHWKNSEWASCSPDGHAEASLDLPLQSKVATFSMSALPSRPVDLELRLTEATGALRRDLAAERDLARRWRSDPIGLLKMRYRMHIAARELAK
jgi:hypothetical protein